MGCSCKRPYLCAILTVGSVALLLHLAGFVTPGWLVMRRSAEEVRIQIKEKLTTMQMQDYAMNDAPVDQQTSTDMPEPEPQPGPEPQLGPGRHHHHHHHHHGPEEESADVHQWLLATVTEISITNVKIQLSYGLWYSTVCIREEKLPMAEMESDDSSDKEQDKKGCGCRKISTQCALMMSWMFEDPLDYINSDAPERLLSEENFGHASLLQHRIENSLALSFMTLGLLAAIVAFRKPTGCKCVAGCASLFMLLAAILVMIPTIRLALYSRYKDNQEFPISVHVPYSIIASGIGAILAFVTALIAAVGTMRLKRQERPGQWYHFNNELEVETKPQDEKKSQLVFLAEPLPEKPGMYDVCDFAFAETEKVPLE